MESAPPFDRQPGRPDAALAQNARDPSVRRCLATGEELPKDELIRFVVGPDNEVVPDLAQNLPGRGLWVKADAEAIALAVRKNLFAKAAHKSVTADAELVALVGRLLRKRCLELLGLARGAGLSVLGQPQVEAALRAGKLDLILLAPDAGSELPSHEAVVTRHFTREELGAAFGYGQIVYAGLMPHALTVRIKKELTRLEKIPSTHHILQ